MEDTPPSTNSRCASEVDGDEFFDALQGSPVRVMMVGGKRRRLNDDSDDGEVPENEHEDKDCSPASAPKPSAASATPASVLAVYTHNAQHFQCTLCSRHRRTAFLDRFSAGCACGQPFASRLAAARHSLACSTLSATSSATAVSAVGASSPAASPVQATVRVAAASALPPQVTSEDAGSPPPAPSPIHAASRADSEQCDSRGYFEQYASRVQTDSRWSHPLPRALIASRIAERLGALHSRWDQPLPRAVIAQRIADRLGRAPPSSPKSGLSIDADITPTAISGTPTPEAPSAPPAAQDSSAADVDSPDVAMAEGNTDATSATPAIDTSGEWLLRFDGACRGNPGYGGADAALFNPAGTVVWTGSSFMSSQAETNNTAEYAALLIGIRAAADHGALLLRVEGDSRLVIDQVRGRCRTLNKRLAAFGKLVKTELQRLDKTTLHHIDRQENAHADRLANRALDAARTETVCGVHSDGDGCTPTEIDLSALRPVEVGEQLEPPVAISAIVGSRDVNMEAQDSDVGPQADIDDGEMYLPMNIGGETIPHRRPRLRLRELSEDETDSAAAIMGRLGATLAGKIADAADWDAAEGYITALPYLIYEKLQPFTAAPVRFQPPSRRQQQQPIRSGGVRQPPSGACEVRQPLSGAGGRQKSQRRKQRRRRPPRTTPFCRERRLDEALDNLRAVEQNSSSSRKSIFKARRRVGRIRKSQSQQLLRHQFGQNEKSCVAGILERARAARAPPAQSDATNEAARLTNANAQPDPNKCPIPGTRLWQHFKEVNTPRTTFDPDAPVGSAFREAMARLPVATASPELLTEAPSAEEIESQLQRLKPGSSPGLDGVGYDIYRQFSLQLLPALSAAYKCCWDHQRIPLSWKLGTVRLIYKKGDRDDPHNWRPICLQQAIYKIYAGVLAKRFTRWMELNQRHASAQKGFRAVNGCGEHNFVASTLVDQARRKKRELRMIWYDLENAFGSVLHELLWYILGLLGAPPSFIERCRGNYSDAAFVIANAMDGPTATVRLKVGVFQGCPLSPHLFTAVLTPLLLALEHLPNAGVQLSGEDRPGACAYADDLKVFSTTAAGIASQHNLVVDFLRWTGLRANPTKCRSLSLERNARSTLVAVDMKLSVDDVPIASLSRHQGYTYLGIGDGFDHVRSRIELEPAITELKHDATALVQSGLAPWQVVKAVKTYLYPRIDYALRHLRPFHQQLAGFDRHLVRGLRQLLHLPPQSTNEFFYAPVTRGGLGLLPLTELHGALQLAFGWQMLHSPDPAIQRIAQVQLRDIAAARHHLDSSHWAAREGELCELLLNSKLGNSVHAPKKRHYSDIGSLWTDIQRHLEAFELTLETAPAQADTGAPAAPLQLRVPHHDGWLDHRTVLRQIKMHLKYRHWRRWTAMKDQGRVARAIGGAGSSFLTRPRNLWEADYRFAVAARLNQIDTNSVLQRKRLRNHATCRHPGCAWKETLGHVLGHCKGTEDAVCGRHDKILQLISSAIEGSSRSRRDQLELLVDQTVPTLPGPALRPDVQLYNRAKRTVAIVDLAVTYEEHTGDAPSSSAMARVADQKRKKYAGVKRHLENQGWRVQLSALVYGALGAVAGGNHKVLTTELGLLKREAKWLDKRISASSISSSRRIWAEHCSKHRRNQHDQQRGSRATETGGTPSNTGRN